MADTAVVNPMYTGGGPPPPYQSWSDSMAKNGPLSPLEPRRTSDIKQDYVHTYPAPATQKPTLPSLPSIQEALNGTSRTAAYHSPVASSYTIPPPPPAIFPHTSSASTRPYPVKENPFNTTLNRPPSPPRSTYSSTILRTETQSYPEPKRSSTTSLHSVVGTPSSYAAPRYESETKLPDRAGSGFPHHPQPPTSSSTYSYGTPSSEGHHHARSAHHPEPKYYSNEKQETDHWKGRSEKQAWSEKQAYIPFQQNLKRSFEGYDFENSLSCIHKATDVIGDWSRYYHEVAQEQHRSMNTIPDRAPSIASCQEMRSRAQAMIAKIDLIEQMVQQQEQTMLADQRMREQTMRMAAYDEDSMYGEDSKHAFEGKKRRGRAAPPGRCHSCNRMETPEWRRGPDGARTLCNACGLHYAKLTRKQQSMKQGQGNSNGGSLRPKSMDGSV